MAPNTISKAKREWWNRETIFIIHIKQRDILLRELLETGKKKKREMSKGFEEKAQQIQTCDTHMMVRVGRECTVTSHWGWGTKEDIREGRSASIYQFQMDILFVQVHFWEFMPQIALHMYEMIHAQSESLQHQLQGEGPVKWIQCFFTVGRCAVFYAEGAPRYTEWKSMSGIMGCILHI